MSITVDHAAPGTPYVPGSYLDATRGLTISQFESVNGLYKAIPAEDGFLRDPVALQRAIVVCNYTGTDLSVVCDRDKRINKDRPAVRENEKELNAMLLPNGTSSHFNIPPFCFHVTVSEFVISENGGQKWVTREGFPLTDIANQNITYRNGEAEGLTSSSANTANLDNYAYVNNYSTNSIKVSITKSATAYAPSEEEIIETKMSRLPDTGGEIQEENHIRPGGGWHFKQPPRKYTIRAMETLAEMDGESTIMGDNSRVPDISNYIQLAETNAVAGQVVVFFADHSRNGGIRAKTYNCGEIKLVKSDIVQTNRDDLQ